MKTEENNEEFGNLTQTHLSKTDGKSLNISKEWERKGGAEGNEVTESMSPKYTCSPVVLD